MSDPISEQLRQYIRNIPDFPKPGILFRDITPLLANAEAFRLAVREMASRVADWQVQLVAAAEARGFLFAAPVAVELGVGIVPIRKPGKLPFKTISHSYELEYGTDTLEIHADAVQPGTRVLVIDDVLATGGTVEACCKLVEKAGGVIAGCAFLIELATLNGAQRIANYNRLSLIRFD